MKVEVRKLSKQFKDNIIFRDYNLVIQSGAMVGIWGESGAGKTTLLNIIGGIENYTKGEVYFDDVLITKKNIHNYWRRDLSFIFQNYGLVDNLSVLDNMKLLYHYKELSEDSIKAALTDLHLEDKLNSKVFELSGGQQQRVALVKTKLKQSKLILADEPTASVDEDHKEIILNELRHLNKMGATVLIVSHDRSVLEQCDYIINIES